MIEFKVEGCTCNITVTNKRHYAVLLISDDSKREPMVVKISPAPSDEDLQKMGEDLARKFKEQG